MNLEHYAEITPTLIDNDKVKHVAARVVIGRAAGAGNFFMRVFEIGRGGHTPRHSHPWEHEMFFHAGQGQVLHDGEWKAVRAGSVVFMPPGAEHEVRNTGAEPLVLVCLVPAAAPEL